MKSVLISIRPKWCEKIASGEKTIEVRKSRPKIDTPFKCYIYCTKDKRLVCKFDKGEDCYGDILKEPLYVHRHCLINGNIVDGKVIGEFVCNLVDEYPYDYCDGVDIDDDTILETAIGRKAINIYAKGKPLYGWHISDLKIYDKPKELSEFYTIAESGSDCCCACVYHETPLEEMPCRTCTSERRYLYRPPQSWQYVEELTNEQI